MIGKSEREGADGPQLWYRIVPPSGEYRWVKREQVVDSSEKLVQAARAQNNQPSSARRSTALRQKSKQNTIPSDRFVEESNADESTVSGDEQLRDRADESSLAGAEGALALQPAPQPKEISVTGEDEVWHSNDTRLAVDNPDDPDNQDNGADINPKPTPAEASTAEVAFIGRPKLLEIGTRSTAPQQTVAAGDANWVTGTTPRSIPSPGQPNSAVAGATLSNPIAQVAGQSPVFPQTLATASTTTQHPGNVVPRARIAQIEAETQNANVERLDLLFSRLMAAQATSAEIEPIARAAQQLSTSTADSTAAGRARMLLERTEQYRRIADRRVGRGLVGQSISSHVPASNLFPAAGTSLDLGAVPGSDSSVESGQAINEMALTGYLVQVYSARSSSPPFALTDNTGRTIAYVTPTPGTNLRVHLNSEVHVAGHPGYVTGLNTPHIVATTVTRTVE